MFNLSSANPLAVGADAPDATAPDQSGQLVRLSEAYLKSEYTLVYFYPKASTPGCTAQGCSLRDAYEALTAKGVAIYGVSSDSVESQRKFKEEQRFPFSLLADTEKKVIAAFGVGTTFGFSARQAYLIHKGKVVYADHKGSTRQQAEDILGYLAQAKK